MSTGTPITLRRFLRLESAPAVTTVATAPRSGLLTHQIRERARVSDRFPDAPLKTHRGETLRFRSDCVRNQRVIIGFIYTRCDGICPATTAHMAAVHAMLSEQIKDGFRMISLSVDPERDTPADLMEYATDSEVAGHANWDFAVSSRAGTDLILRSLGLAGKDPAVDAQLRNHSGMLVFGNDRRDRWSAIPAGTEPVHIAHSFLRITRDGGLGAMIAGVP